MNRILWFGLPLFLCAFAGRGAENPSIEDARRNSTSFSANRHAAEYYLVGKDLSSAIPYLEKAREIDASDYANGYDLALAYLETGSPEKSRAIIQSILFRGDKAELHNLLGDVEEAEGHANEAARQYEQAARSDPSEKNLFDLGGHLLKHRDFLPAVEVFEFAAQRYSKSAGLRVGLGVAYYSSGRYDKAVEALCRAVDLDPKDTKALDFLGRMYDVSPQYANQVTERLAHFVSLYPASGAANYYYALSLRKRSLANDSATTRKQAEVYFLKALQASPEFPEAHFELGLLYEDELRNADAIHQYELAAARQPRRVKIHYHLARLYRKRGEEALAIKEFQVVNSLKSSE